MPIVFANERDLREFVQAKRLHKSEPVHVTLRRHFKGRAVACATFRPSDPSHFRQFCLRLRDNSHYGKASERLAELWRAYRKRYGAPLPCPFEVEQTRHQALSLRYSDTGGLLTVLCTPETIGAVIGGTKGKIVRGPHRELLEALHFLSRISNGTPSRRHS